MSDMDALPTGTRQKALALNLDKAKYGNIAEIGAGQEVARWFFLVGGAAGTVAKSTSAYDMAVSDAIYGPTKRYVSRERLRAMLESAGRLFKRSVKVYAYPDTSKAKRLFGWTPGAGA